MSLIFSQFLETIFTRNAASRGLSAVSVYNSVKGPQPLALFGIFLGPTNWEHRGLVGIW